MSLLISQFLGMVSWWPWGWSSPIWLLSLPLSPGSLCSSPSAPGCFSPETCTCMMASVPLWDMTSPEPTWITPSLPSSLCSKVTLLEVPSLYTGVEELVPLPVFIYLLALQNMSSPPDIGPTTLCKGSLDENQSSLLFTAISNSAFQVVGAQKLCVFAE